MEDERLEIRIIVTVLVMILLVGLFEATILGMAYFYADKVECNLLWCTFTTTRSNITQWTTTSETVIMSNTSSCSVNGVAVNCSTITPYWEE